MDNQKVTKLWEPNVDFPNLRKPATLVKRDNVTSESNISNVDLVTKSTLSVDAKEFYPAGFNLGSAPTSGNARSVQDRLKKYKATENNDSESSNREYDFLYNSLELLTVKPGKFDTVVPSLIENLEPHFQNVEAISKITEIIFMQALTEPNFTYTGARLCAVLDEQCPMLRACLHNLCERELNNAASLSALTMFFAEIYTQMNYELFGKCLLKALKKMLVSPSSDNVKYICQTLKLSGAKLDELDKSVIDKIFESLNALSPSLPSSISNLVQSVINLRSKQWGLVESVNSPPPPPAEPVEWSDEPVYYGPDGQRLTAEESEFLSEHLSDLILDDSDPDELWNPEPEMNDEIQAAFAEFVRMNQR